MADGVAAVYIAATDRVWVARSGSGLNILNPSTGAVLSNPVPGQVDQLVTVPLSARVFYRDLAANEVRSADCVTGADDALLVAGGIVMPVYDETNPYVYVETSAGELAIYNSNTLALVSTTATLSAVNFGCPAYVPANNRVYVGVDGVGVRVYNPLTGALVTTIAYGAAYLFYGAVWSPEAARVVLVAYNGTADEAIFIDPTSNLVTDTLALPTSVSDTKNSTFRSLNTGAVYAISGGDPAVINPLTPEVVCSISMVGTIPKNLAFATSNETVWFADAFETRVERFTE